MATYFVSKDGNGTAATSDPGTSGAWTTAYATLASAITAATTTGDTIKVSDEHFEDLGADTVYTLGASGIKIICVDHDNTAVASAMDYTNAYIGNKSSQRSIIFLTSTAGWYLYLYGMCFVVTASDNFTFSLNRGHVDFDAGIIQVGTGNLSIGVGDIPTAARISNTEIKYTNALSRIVMAGYAEFVDCAFTGTSPTNLAVSGLSNDSGGSIVRFIGCDLSIATNYLFGEIAQTANTPTAYVVQCKLGSGVTVLNTGTAVGNAYWNVFIHDCSSGDDHYKFEYHDILGSVVADTGIYANDGAEYNSTGTKASWKIVTTSAASVYHPFKTPWLSVHHEGTSAITPSLEIVRSGSATAFQNDEVWSEWTVKTTSGSTLATFNDSDKVATPLTTPANQDTGALDASGWTGENATSWFGKLCPTASITPAEIGDIAARVCVGEPSTTVYVDPQIRGLS